MNILLINSVCGIRSTGRIATDIADKYMSEGHKVIIAYGREDVPEKYRNISHKIGTESNVRINGLKARIFDNEGFNAKKETKKFIEFANKFNPDVLWLHNIHGYYINIEILFEWIKTRPDMEVKWTLHDCWAFTGHCSHFSYVKCEKWRDGCYKCPQTKRYPASFCVDSSKKNYIRKKKAFCEVKNMTIITPSQWLASLVKDSFLKEYNVEVHNNKIDNAVFKPTVSNFRKNNDLENKKIVLGVASAWDDRKGLDDFYKLAKILGDEYKIILVGLSKNQIKKSPKSVLCIQRTNSKEELACIYTAADIFVNLTYEDTYPTVNIEAQACGTPCLTYRTGGSVESVPFENIVEQGNVVAMAEKIKSMSEQ